MYIKIEIPQKKLEAINNAYKVEVNTINFQNILCKIFAESYAFASRKS